MKPGQAQQGQLILVLHRICWGGLEQFGARTVHSGSCVRALILLSGFFDSFYVASLGVSTWWSQGTLTSHVATSFLQRAKVELLDLFEA